MRKYIDSEKLIDEIERQKQENETSDDKEYVQYEFDVACGYDMACEKILSIIASLQQEQTNGIDGVVHHALRSHWIVPDKEQLTTTLKEFPEGAEVKLFICAKKGESK